MAISFTSQKRSSAHAVLAALPKMASSAWRSLPHKDQLAILTSVRLVDFYQLTSVQTCAYWLLQSLDPHLPADGLSVRVGILQGLFTAGQMVSGTPWGRVADVYGRKPVLLAGLTGMALICVLTAFSTSFTTLAVFRLLAGLVNGTTASCKASVADTFAPEQHGRAFATLFLSFNVATVVGPVTSAALFSPGSRYPFAAPSLLSALLLGGDAILVLLCLRESLPQHHGTESHRLLAAKPYQDGDDECAEVGEERGGEEAEEEEEEMQAAFPTPRLWTRRFIGPLVVFALHEYHLGAFTTLWPLFLASPGRGPDILVKLPLRFSGGLQLTPAEVGAAMSTLGWVGLSLQLAIIATARHGVVKAFGATQPLFALTYAIAPYLALVPAHSLALWASVLVGKALHAVARTYALLATTMLLDAAAPCQTLRATAHGIAAVISGLCRTHGAVVAGILHGWGQSNNASGLAWWFCSLLSVVGWALSLCI